MLLLSSAVPALKLWTASDHLDENIDPVERSPVLELVGYLTVGVADRRHVHRHSRSDEGFHRPRQGTE